MRTSRAGIWVLVVAVYCLVGLALLSAPAAAEGPDGMAGNGTEADPYEITNATQLQAMEDDPGASYTLIADVNASGTADWADGGFDPVGEDDSEFTGSLDGDGHSISNLTLSGESGYSGLFGVAFADGRIANLSLANASAPHGGAATGLLAANGHGATIENVHVTGTVTSDGTYVGGLVGWSRNSHIYDSTANVSIEGDGESVGGLVGRNSAEIHTSFATGPVANGDGNVGGLVGENDDDATIEDSYWDVDTTGQDDSAGGGTGLTTDQMTGTNAGTDGNMDGFDFEDTWTHADGYPLLTWQIEGVALSVDSAEIEPAESTRATVVLALADGSIATATETADYASDDASVATAANGTVTAVDNGSTTIAAAVAGQNSSTSIVVASPSDGGSPGDGDSIVSVVDLAVENATPLVGETVTATVTVENDGASTETYDGALALDGEAIAEESITVGAGESASYTVTHAFDEPGEYTLSAGGESVTVTVGDESDGGETDDGTDGDDDGSDDDGAPGFGAMVALVSIALVAATRLARRS